MIPLISPFEINCKGSCIMTTIKRRTLGKALISCSAGHTVSTVGPRPSSARAHPHSAYRKRMIRRREVSSLFLIGEVETKLTCINKLGFYSAALGARMARAWSGVSWIYAVDETGLVTATAKIKPCANKRCCSRALPTVSPAQTWALLSSVLR